MRRLLFFMAVYTISAVQRIPVTPGRAWDFFSDPGNLPLITPPDMGFRIISPPSGNRIYAGQLIEYRLRPLPGWSVYWMTEITQVQDAVYFIDEQRFGPYSLWHHQHHFREIPGGVEMTDIVHYKAPFGWLGTLANALFIRKQLDRIFGYRRQQVEKLFGKWQPSAGAGEEE
jgi:ligand-binding SRPBCC domain-containing protein